MPRNIWKFAILGAAVVLLLLMLVWRWPFYRRGSPATVASLTLAVVEIENLSDDRSLDWLGNGVVELLTSDLAQSKSLGVISTERIRGLIRQRLKSEGHLPPSEAQEGAKDSKFQDIELSSVACLSIRAGDRSRRGIQANESLSVES